jgi:hypothetical protein
MDINRTAIVRDSAKCQSISSSSSKMKARFILFFAIAGAVRSDDAEDVIEKISRDLILTARAETALA